MFGGGTYGQTILPPGVEPIVAPSAIPFVSPTSATTDQSAGRSEAGNVVATARDRLVISPARITGSMDAEDVTLDTWRGEALRMLARERCAVELYRIDTEGRWMLVNGLGRDGKVRR